MTDETLLGLALQAMTGDDAIVVLQDAAFELTPEQNRQLSEKVLSRFSWWQINTGPRVNAYAIAAVLLFESWPTSWPLALRCRRPRIPRVGVGEYEFIDEGGTWLDEYIGAPSQRHGNEPGEKR